jgi:hypothetical protein
VTHEVDPAQGRPRGAADRWVPGRHDDRCLRAVTTVLGPGSDGYHEDYIHLKSHRARSGCRICQWELQQTALCIAASSQPAGCSACPRRRHGLARPLPRPFEAADARTAVIFPVESHHR